ncbi:ROK family protein [Thermomonospora umbrina]|uniref:Glucokinase n=1 Tax=Thermomonospora umbrina TaxID=111806 RepID=A0A3D9SRZ7_9ACTN|nr:ROK family protein [Thermomonospora umbrina]REE98736.1 glucokinase [Thermomonospora umbrina]
MTVPSAPCVAALDVGGTRIKAGLVDAGHRLHADRLHDTGREDGPEAVIDRVLDILDGLVAEAGASGLTPVAASVVLPGIVDETTGRVVYSANVGWRDLPLAERLTERIALPTAVGHDVRAGGLAESLLGAGRGETDLLFMPIGTGIAGAMIMDGRPYSADGYAGEIGHMRVTPDGPPCPCGGRGCLEVYASASSVGRRYTELHTDGTPVSAAEVAQRVAAGESAAVEIWQDAVDALATALHTYTTICAPRLIVIGGGLSESGDLLLDPLRKALETRLTFQRPPRIVRAALGDRAGLLGAALLAWRTAGI